LHELFEVQFGFVEAHFHVGEHFRSSIFRRYLETFQFRIFVADFKGVAQAAEARGHEACAVFEHVIEHDGADHAESSPLNIRMNNFVFRHIFQDQIEIEISRVMRNASVMFFPAMLIVEEIQKLSGAGFVRVGGETLANNCSAFVGLIDDMTYRIAQSTSFLFSN